MGKQLLRRLVGVLSILMLAVSGLVSFTPATVAAEGVDCDSNAVIFCGVTDLENLKAKYRMNQGGDLHKIYAHFSIPNAEFMNGMVMGKVTKTGEVWVGNEKVATGAVTAGRVKMGSDEVKVPGANAWMRPPSRSFRSTSLSAFVKMKDGRFHSAVIRSCGNPVNAYPVEKPKPKPKPKPQPKKPSLDIKKDVRVLGESAWRQSVTADPGDVLQYMITVRNTGDVDLKNVRVRDSLPEGVSFEDVKIDIAPTPNNFDFSIGDLVGQGINLGTIPKGGLRQITFSVTIGNEVDACEEKLRNVVHAKADNVPEEEDDALARVCQPEEEEKPAPQVRAEQTPPPAKGLPVTGPGTVVFGAFSMSSFLGFAAYKLKEFYSLFLR